MAAAGHTVMYVITHNGKFLGAGRGRFGHLRWFEDPMKAMLYDLEVTAKRRLIGRKPPKGSKVVPIEITWSL